MPNPPDVIFVNTMAVSGFLNGVVNLSFTTAQFNARDGKVEPDVFPSAYLRMDLACAQQVHAALGRIIDDNTKPPTAEELN